MSGRRSLLRLVSLALALPASVALEEVPAETLERSAARVPASDTVLDWEQTAIDVVYQRQPPPPQIPVGVPTLGFTSVAMYDAVTRSLARRGSSERAAATIAAFRVLAEYVPNQRDYLLAQRSVSLAEVRAGAAKRLGMRIGRQAAVRMIRSRVGDGRELAGKVTYRRPADPGVWQPDPPASDMAFAHLGFVDLLMLDHRVRLDGPDPLVSPAYARDFNEVKELGSNRPPAPGDTAAAARSATAVFFNSNSATMIGLATIAYLRDHPRGIRTTAHLFAAMHGAMTDSVITCWRLKFNVGFWRPNQAIRRAAEDGNPATTADPTWEPLLATPAYSDYVSGHAALTAPAAQVVRTMLGERTPLELVNPTTGERRTYSTLTALEHDAFHARIWGGFHFRDAMDDGYLLGHRTARRVMALLD